MAATCWIFKYMTQIYSACRDGARVEQHLLQTEIPKCILVLVYFACTLFSFFCFVVVVKSMFSLEARSLYSPVVIMKWKMVLGWALVLRRGNTSPLLTFAPNTHTESFCSVLDRVNGPSPNTKYTWIHKKVRERFYGAKSCFQNYSRQI